MLTRNTGEGHNRVAQAVKQAFEAQGDYCEIADALRLASGDWEEPDSSPGKRRADVLSQLYGWAALKMPALFGAAYNLGDLYSRTRAPSPIRSQNSQYAEATHTYIRDHWFDAVVATHLFPQETLSVVRSRHPSEVRYYGVLTDYSCTPFFSEPVLDGYFVPHPDMMPDCLKHGLPAAATYPVGLPVASAFQRPPTRAEARSLLGLPENLPVFLLMSGGVGSLYTVGACDRLLAGGGGDTCVVILTGRRQDLFASVSARFADDQRVRVVPFTDRVADYMAAADILLTKPGAVTSTEAAVMGLPLIHTAAVPGGEVKNARFFAGHGMSLYEQKPGEAARLMHWLLDDRAKMAGIRECQQDNVVVDAAERVVDQIKADI